MTESLPARPLAVGDRVRNRTYPHTGSTGVVRSLTAKRAGRCMVDWTSPIGSKWRSAIMPKNLLFADAAWADCVPTVNHPFIIKITLPAPLATRFAIEAERRRLSCDALAEMLLETVATDGLFAALLDD